MVEIWPDTTVRRTIKKMRIEIITSKRKQRPDKMIRSFLILSKISCRFDFNALMLLLVWSTAGCGLEGFSSVAVLDIRGLRSAESTFFMPSISLLSSSDLNVIISAVFSLRYIVSSFAPGRDDELRSRHISIIWKTIGGIWGLKVNVEALDGSFIAVFSAADSSLNFAVIFEEAVFSNPSSKRMIPKE